MDNKINDLKNIYKFIGKIYTANWQTRWGETPFMSDFAQQKEINKFVSNVGKFESVPGHVWACCIMWMQLRRVCPELNKVVNTNDLYEQILVHDIGETYNGDTPLSVKINGSMTMGKEEERRGFIELIKSLPEPEQNRMIKWFDNFENEGDKNSTIETLIARWIDNLQGDHFGLTYGTNLPEHSSLIEKIIKKRSVGRARNLIDNLNVIGKYEASKEVEELTKAHIQIIRDAGISLNLEDLGF